MLRIPFIEARFHDPDESRLAIEARFTRHLRKLRQPNPRSDAPFGHDAGEGVAAGRVPQQAGHPD